MNTELNNAKEELGEYKRKESSNLEQMLEDPTQLLEEQIEESNKLIKTLKDENKYLENELQKKEAKAKKAEEFEAKNNFLNNTIERMKKNEEELKNQKKKIEDDYKEEIKKYEDNLGQIKFQLATTTFDKENNEVKLKRYINKLQNKLASLGFKFKDKK